MEHEEGLVISAGPKFGFVKKPGCQPRIYWLADAPSLQKNNSVKYRVVPQPTKPHDLATDIQLMDVE